jgi:hypothetical protein
MLIHATDLTLSSTHELETSTTRQLRLVAQPRAEASFAKLLDSQTQAPPAQLLEVESAPQSIMRTQKSPFQTLLELLVGLPDILAGALPFEDTSAVRSPPRALQISELTHHSESERCTFAASGNVCLADGSTRQFAVDYQMERSEESTNLQTVAMLDPLVLDLIAPAAGLNPQSVDFDLDSDGTTESMRMPSTGSALLFNDRNHNGRADNGSELFGATSGDGFAELAKLDGDGNGWIDGGDTAFADIQLWELSDDGTSRVRSLADAGIGALATENVATPFTLKEDGESIGRMRASSVWLGETTGAGTVREIDLAVTKPGANID